MAAPDAAADAAGPSAAARRRCATRERLREAALGLFAQRRVADVSVEDLLAAAGVSRATFYLHFAGKAELVEELGAGLWELSESAALAVNELPSWSRPRLRAFLGERAGSEWAAARPLAAAVGEALVADEDAYREHLDRLVERLIAGDGRWSAMGEESARMRARLFAMQLGEFFLHWAIWGVADDRERELSILAELCWTALHAGGGGDGGR